MKFGHILIYYNQLKPQTKETFINGVKVGMYLGLFLASIVFGILNYFLQK